MSRKNEAASPRGRRPTGLDLLKRTSVALLALLVILGGVLALTREGTWQVTYHPFNGYNMAKDESGRFIYADRGGGVVSILTIDAGDPRIVGSAIQPASIFEQEALAVSRGWLFTSSAGEGNVSAFDVRDPALPLRYGPVHLGMTTHDVDVLGDLLVIGGERVGGPGLGRLIALNATDPPSDFLPNGSAPIRFRLDFPSPVLSIAVDDSLLYVAEGTQAGIIHLFDAQSVPPLELTNLSIGMRYPRVFVDEPVVAVTGSLDNESYIHLLNHAGSSLQSLVRFQKSAGSVSFEDQAMFVSGVPSGDVTHSTRDISIYDISNPSDPRRTAYVEVRGYGLTHVVDRGTVYSLGFDNLARVAFVQEPVLLTRGWQLPYGASLVTTVVLTVVAWRSSHGSRKDSASGEEPGDAASLLRHQETAVGSTRSRRGS